MAAKSDSADKPRRDGLSGICLDLAPRAADSKIRSEISCGHIRQCLQEVHPDSEQFVFNGRGGWQDFYPSLISRSSRGNVQDSLALWRRVTAQAGVNLFIHCSGPWDSLRPKYLASWARLQRDYSGNNRQTNLCKSYPQNLRIPQWLKISEQYKPARAWIDWKSRLSQPNYSSTALAATRDLVAWSVQISSTHPPRLDHKPAAQLEQGSAAVLAQGGELQIDYQPTRSGRSRASHITVIVWIVRFRRERQTLCHHCLSLSHAAGLLSKISPIRRSNQLFGIWARHNAPCTAARRDAWDSAFR